MKCKNKGEEERVREIEIEKDGRGDFWHCAIHVCSKHGLHDDVGKIFRGKFINILVKTSLSAK